MPVRIGIIDSGLPAGHEWPVIAARNFSGDGKAKEMVDRLGHGTTVVKAILNSGVDIELCVARVFDRQLTCSATMCSQALQWLVTLEPCFINMSFGLRRDDAALRLVCDRASEVGIGLIAASPAQGDPVYPSSYEHVLRATGDARCQSGEIAWLASQQADFGGYVGDPGAGPAGASIGCASVSARIAALAAMHPGVNFRKLIEHLAAEADYVGVEVKSRNPLS